MAALLGVDAVRRDDDLLELGLHSLLGTRAVNRLRARFGVELPLRALFDRPTVAAVAAQVDALTAPVDVPAGDAARRAPAPAQRSAPGSAAGSELAAEVRLDPEVRARTVPRARGAGEATEPAAGPPLTGRVLLTGATGTVGSALLATLLECTPAHVTCLVRGSSNTAFERVAQAAAASGAERVDPARVDVVTGTLARERFGLDLDRFADLAASVDDVLHAGASVNFLPPYRRLAPTNVGGTHEVLRLAAAGGARVHHISSTAVHGRWQPGGATYDEAPLGAQPPALDNGYEQTKWVAERLVRLAQERGLPATVYRLGRVAGHSGTGAWKLGDVLSQVLRACVALGQVPDTDSDIDLVPVDVAARTVVAAASNPAAAGRHVTVASASRFRFPVLAEAMEGCGLRAETVPLERWVEGLRVLASGEQDATWAMVLAVLEPWAADLAAGLREGRYVTGQAQRLAGADAAGVEVDAALLRRYLRHFADVGFVPALPVGVSS
jgi:surfactin family lipopeptide synthetase C